MIQADSPRRGSASPRIEALTRKNGLRMSGKIGNYITISISTPNSLAIDFMVSIVGFRLPFSICER